MSNGSIASTSDLSEYIKGSILQNILITQGELVSNPEYGIPYFLFTSRATFDKDVGVLNAILSSSLPHVTFNTTGFINDAGMSTINVYWSIRAVTSSISFSGVSQL